MTQDKPRQTQQRVYRLLQTVIVVVSMCAGLSAQAASLRFDEAMREYRAGNYEQAFLALSALAEQGHEQAQFRLGLMFHQGRGAPRNYRLATDWYRKAAEQGHAGAQNNLGVIYRDGDGVRPNRVVSYMWFSLAAAQFNERARRSVDKLERELTRDQLLQAQQLTSEYTAKQWERKRVAQRAEDVPLEQGYAVQLGLFGDAENVNRVVSRLAEEEIAVLLETVEVNGAEYQRMRVGPFKSEQDAETVAKRMDDLFDLKSLVVGLH